MINVFMNAQGQYYKAEEAKGKGDSFIPYPSPTMLDALSDKPMAAEEVLDLCQQTANALNGTGAPRG